MVYIFLAEGFEIVEAMAPIDMLRRAKIDVRSVGVGGREIKSSCGVPVIADMAESEVTLDDSLDGVILPGGMPGTLNLEKSETVQRALDFAVESGKLICAICAAPSVLGHKGILKGKEAVCFPGFEDTLEGAEVSESFVCYDGNIITAKGAGVATQFGLKIVEALSGKESAEAIRSSIQCDTK